MKSWNKYGDECDSKVQMYWFVTIDVLGGAVGIGPSSRQGQPAGGASRWLPPSFFITLIYEMFYHELLLYCVSIDIKLPNGLMASEWMAGKNGWLALANGIRRDDQDKWLISFG
jgi:hypothetical protein